MKVKYLEDTKRKSKVDYRKLNENKRFANNDLLDEVSEQLSVPRELVKMVADAQSKFVAKTIRSGGLETIVYVYLGKLKVNPYQIQKMMSKSMKS